MDAEAIRFGLLLTRIGAFLYLVPVLGGSYLPRIVKLGLATALAAVWYEPAGPGAAFSTAGDAAWLRVLGAVFRESLLGGMLGYIFVLFLSPAKMAGEFIAQEFGLTFGNVLGATGQNDSNPLTTFLDLFSLVVFLLMDGHQVLLGSLFASLQELPPGEAWTFPMARIGQGIRFCSEWGLVLAGPTALGLILTTVALLLMTRAAPQLNVFSVGYPFRVLMGMLLLIWLLPQFCVAMMTYLGQIMERWKGML